MRHNCEFSKRFLFDDNNDNDDDNDEVDDDNGDDRHGTRVLQGVAPPSFNRRDISTISQHLQKNIFNCSSRSFFNFPVSEPKKTAKKLTQHLRLRKKRREKN